MLVKLSNSQFYSRYTSTTKAQIKVCQKKIYYRINGDDLNPDNIEIRHNIAWVIKFIHKIDDLGEVPISKGKSLNIIEEILCVKYQD